MHPHLTDQSPSEELLAGCRQGDPAAYEILWRYLYRVALRFTYDRPGGEALAEDCAQMALVRVYRRLDEIQEPAALRSWSRRIVSNIAIDRLRRDKRLTPLADDEREGRDGAVVENGESPATVAARLDTASLRDLLQSSPMSDRSRRVVLGRYFDDEPDEELAKRESELAGSAVRPSHIQVTRAKNIAKLRQWPLLFEYLGKVQDPSDVS